jgi:hypothetical protein
MGVKRPLRHHVAAQKSQRTPGFRAEGTAARWVRGFCESEPETLLQISGTPIHVDSYPRFESGEIAIDRVFRICMRVVVERRDLTV